MAVDMFLKISGIDGESTDDKHKGEIEILSFSWGVTNVRPSTANRLSSAGKTKLQDFSVVKYVDVASPKLFVSSCQGAHFPEAHVTMRKAGKEQQEFYKVTLQDVLISSVAPGGSAGGEMLPTEQISFSFGSALVSASSSDGRTSTQVSCGGSLDEEPPVLIEEQKKK